MGMEKRAFVAVAGNIGTGKSTLSEFLGRQLPVQPIFEPFEENPFLVPFYDDMPRWAFHSQIFFLSKKFDLHRQLDEREQSVILDRTIYEDAEIFARSLTDLGYMSGDEHSTYQMFYRSLLETLAPPTVLVYLHASLPVLKRRIRERGREEEQAIPYDYLKQLQHHYRRWRRNYVLSPVIDIDTGKANYLDDLFARSELLARITPYL
jgi:deoxyadenosine/deoxycytidine kinase